MEVVVIVQVEMMEWQQCDMRDRVKLNRFHEGCEGGSSIPQIFIGHLLCVTYDKHQQFKEE